MTMTKSTMLELGTPAPDFRLPDVVTGRLVERSSFNEKKALLVMFLCRHCPFVKHVKGELARLGREYGERGVGVVAISSNDVNTHPHDHPDRLREMAEAEGFSFPLLYDESQEVAKAYTAACTPDFFLFDADQRLVYRGQLDDSRPGNDAPNDGRDLRGALDATLAGEPVPADGQKPSIGCNIKWRSGNEPPYFG